MPHWSRWMLCSFLLTTPCLGLDFLRLSDLPTQGTFTVGVASGDLDGDGLLDVVTTNNASGTITIFRHLGGGQLSFEALLGSGGISGPWWPTIADLNGDGLPDIIIANEDTDRLQVAKNLGAFSFGPLISYDVDSHPEYVNTADLNEDGFTDLVSPNATEVISIYFGDGTGIFSAAGPDVSIPLNHTRGHTVTIADFNLDGHPDLLVAHSSDFNPDCRGGRPPVSVAYGDGSGTNWTVREWGVEMGYHSVPGDFNNDGWPDIASADACGSDVRVLLNDGSGDFSDPPLVFPTGLSHNDLRTHDLNCDGNLDLIVADSSRLDPRLHVLLGDGTGMFAPDANSPFTGFGAPTAVAVGEMDDNATPDIVTTNTSPDSVSVWLNQFQDVEPPEVECQVAIRCLWPPNHKLVDVGLSFSAHDNCQGLLETARVVSVISDEATNSELGAGGKGNASNPTPHAPDAVLEDGRLLLRAERSGLGDGRVYTITVAARDASGNKGIATCEVRVPHDQDPKTPGQVPGNDPAGPCPAIPSGGEHDAFAVN